jgi:SAM-dependent methyltransferase
MHPTDSATRYYDDYWRESRVKSDQEHFHWKAEIVANRPELKAATAILDIGCGDGEMLSLLRGRGKRLLGVDIAAPGVEETKAKGFEAWTVNLDQQPLPVGDAEMDAVLCFDVLEHIFAPDRALDELTRVLRPGGFAMVSVPNAFNAYNRLNYALGRHRDIMDSAHWGAERFSEHIRLFSLDVLTKLLTDHGLNVNEVLTYFPHRFTEPPPLLTPGSAELVHRLGLHRRFPALFGLAFMALCTRT